MTDTEQSPFVVLNADEFPAIAVKERKAKGKPKSELRTAIEQLEPAQGIVVDLGLPIFAKAKNPRGTVGNTLATVRKAFPDREFDRQPVAGKDAILVSRTK